VSTKAGQVQCLLRRLFHTRTTILTSGTLAVKDQDADFRSFRYDLGLLDGIHPVSTRIEPKRHGTLSIILAERSLSTPKQDDPLRDEWLSYVARGIAAAHEEGGEVLVLTTNYADTGAIGEQLADLGVPFLAQSRGQRLADLLLRRPAGTVFITPAGWEGLDSPGGWQHLIVPRIPYPPVGQAAKEDEFSFLNSQEVAMRRLRQALGRALRNPNDAATLWILDPRFPVPAEMMRGGQATQQKATGHLALAQAIPERFRRSGIRRSAWDSATMFHLAPVQQ